MDQVYPYEPEPGYNITPTQEIIIVNNEALGSSFPAPAIMTDNPQGTYFYRMDMHLLKHVGISEAIEAFITSIALTPDALLFCCRGLSYFNLNEYHKALADLYQRHPA